LAGVSLPRAYFRHNPKALPNSVPSNKDFLGFGIVGTLVMFFYHIVPVPGTGTIEGDLKNEKGSDL
jgi:hypothetical protein